MTRRSILLFLFSVAMSANGQSDLSYNLSKYSSQPTACDVEHARRHLFRSHSALVGWLQSDTTLRERNLLQLSGSSHVTSGDYLHYEGRHTTQAEARAGGEMTIPHVGTLYGYVAYSRQQQREQYLNYLSHPTDYMPYLVADTLEQTDPTAERYIIDGGLSFLLGGMRCGLSGHYEGMATAQQSQPRRSVYNYWFSVGLSMAKIMPRWLVSLQVFPEINKQSVSVSSVSTPYTYGLFYGFGQFNRKESKGSFAYSRQMKTLGIGGTLLAALNPADNDGWQAVADIGYNYRYMESEESNYRNLSATKTHTLRHQVAMSHPVGTSAEVHLLLEGWQLWRKGQERVYQQQLMNAAQGLYDFVQVGSNELYKLSNSHERLRLKAVWHSTPQHAFTLTAGTDYDYYDERYSLPFQQVENTTVTPLLAVGYRLSAPRDQLDCDFSVARRYDVSHRYLVDAAPSPTERAMSYIPYLLRGESGYALELNMAYAHSLRSGKSVGCQLQGGLQRRTQAPYLDRPADSSGHHRHIYGTISIFYLF